MKKAVLLTAFLMMISLFGCAKDDSIEIFDVSSLEDFKCMYFTSGEETDFEIEGDAAKDLYGFVTERWQKGKKAEKDDKNENYVALSFQNGDPFVSGDVDEEFLREVVTMVTVEFKYFYGYFHIYEDDYMDYSESIVTSYSERYKLPAGTYDKVLEMLK